MMSKELDYRKHLERFLSDDALDTIIEKNYKLLLSTINNEITDEKRKTKLTKFHTALKDKIMSCPAASMLHLHGSFPGGYVLHVLNVVDLAKQLYDFTKNNGFELNGFTKESLVFCAIVHDLGKIGTFTNEYYKFNDSDWHINNQGRLYKRNANLQHMNIADRSLWLLQKMQIPVTEEEWVSIYSHDGLYIERNKEYLSQFNEYDKPRTDMTWLLHHADKMAERKETHVIFEKTIELPYIFE